MRIKLFIIVTIAFLFASFRITHIPILNFKQLNEQYLNRDTDTLYIINFWATWCGPCVKELPYFEQITEKYKTQKVKVILVSLDFAKNYETTLLPFMQKRKLKSEVILLDDPASNQWIDQVDATWSGSIPATIIYTKNSRKFYEQSFNFEELDSIVKLKIIKK